MSLALSVAMLPLSEHARAALQDYIGIRSVAPTSPGPTTKIEVKAQSGIDIVRITAWLRRVHSEQIYSTIEDFELVSGTPQDGVWRSTEAVTVEQGRYSIDVEAANSTRTYKRPSAGLVDNGLTPAITEFSLGPTTVDIENDTVSYQGRLVYRGADGSEEGLPSMRVLLEAPGRADPESSTVTDSDGRFSAGARIPYTEDVRVASAADDTYRSARTDLVTVTLQRLQTRITAEARPAPPAIGAKPTIEGRLERQSRTGDWAPLGDRTVRVSFRPSYGGATTDVGETLTAADGTYRVPVDVTEPGQWFADYNRAFTSSSESGYAYASATTTYKAYQAYQTEISSFDAGPEPVGKGSSITARGRVVSGLIGRLTLSIDLQFSPDGKSWSGVKADWTQPDGNFTLTAPAERDGYWRATVADGFMYLPSVSAADYVDVKYRTSISSFNASPEPVAKGRTITVDGKLNRYVSSWGALGGKTVYVYFRPYGSKTASYMGVAGSDRYGNWKKGFKAVQDGTWMAKYKGDGTYLPADSASDYVDVR
jgi:hypothetical protein